MRKFETYVGPMHNLVVFEAAARHLSFSRAAMELSVTQPAVSQAIRRLEGFIGASLFNRKHRKIELTDAGELLYSEVADAFGRIVAITHQIRHATKSEHVTIVASTAFATWWLVPRLAEFRRLNPGIDLRIETVDKDVEIERPATTLAIRRGNNSEQWPGHIAVAVAPERLGIAASPTYINRLETPLNLPQLSDLPLVHLDEPHRYRPNWEAFFLAMGHKWHDEGDGLRLNDYALVLQAAMAGQGLAMSWEHTTSWLIAQGFLQKVGSWTWDTGAAFYVVWKEKEELSEAAKFTRDWILRVRNELPGPLA